jgi:hypothetical protein
VAMQFNAVVETNAHAIRLWESLGSRSSPLSQKHSGVLTVGSLASASCNGFFDRTC